GAVPTARPAAHTPAGVGGACGLLLLWGVSKEMTGCIEERIERVHEKSRWDVSDISCRGSIRRCWWSLIRRSSTLPWISPSGTSCAAPTLCHWLLPGHYRGCGPQPVLSPC